VPLFVEELTKTVLESGLLKDAGDHYELSGPLPPLAIPSTLHDSLLARLDRLAPVKEFAQIGAAIGRKFSHALLAAVADRPDAELQDALDQLVASELVFRRGITSDATYAFKHVLVQGVAYGTLLKSRRRQLHARIAQVLEDHFPEQIEAQPELIAHHCTQAGLTEKAIEYRYKAGRQAMVRSAGVEAVAQLQRGLELVAALPDGPRRGFRELELQTSLGGALLDVKGWAAQGELLLSLAKPDSREAEVHFQRAIGVAREQNAKMWELRAAMSLARLWRDQGRSAEAHDLLAPIYLWFTEGFGTADLKGAKALLDELQ
jgi:predicted ATPase